MGSKDACHGAAWRASGGACAAGRGGGEFFDRVKDRFLNKVAQTIARHGLLGSRDSVLVAVSGGPDSVALLAALLDLNRGSWRIGVGHVDHRLRGRESLRDRRFVERLAARLGCEVHVAEVSLARGPNLEERARDAR